MKRSNRLLLAFFLLLLVHGPQYSSGVRAPEHEVLSSDSLEHYRVLPVAKEPISGTYSEQGESTGAANIKGRTERNSINDRVGEGHSVIRNYESTGDGQVGWGHRLNDSTSRVALPPSTELNPASARVVAPQKKKYRLPMPRISFFSIIPSAIAAALLPEKPRLAPRHQNDKLKKIEYRSSPLQGTEARDSIAIRLKPPQLDTNDENNVTRLLAKAVPNDTLEGATINNEGESMKARAQTPMLEQTTHVSAVENATNSESFESDVSFGFWSTFVRRLKQKAERVPWILHRLVPNARRAQETEFNKGSNNTENAGPSYTADDISRMVDAIIRQIQLKQDEVVEHGEMLRKTNRWSSEQGSKPFNDKFVELLNTKARIFAESPAELVGQLARSAESALGTARSSLSASDLRDVVQKAGKVIIARLS